MKNRYEQWGHESFIDNETKEVSGDFIELMNKQNEIIADLEAKLAVADDCADRYWKQLGVVENENKELKAKLAEREKELEKCNDEWTEICDGKLETINRLIEEKHELEQIITSKSHNKWLKAEAERYKNEYQSLKGYIDQLKQQLAEKDEYIKYNVPKLIEANEMMSKQLTEKEKELHTANQETLHFQNKYFAEKQIAIEELKKTRYYAKHIQGGLIDYIDQQIKTLKGDK